MPHDRDMWEHEETVPHHPNCRCGPVPSLSESGRAAIAEQARRLVAKFKADQVAVDWLIYSTARDARLGRID